jgi:hypothetical protein
MSRPKLHNDPQRVSVVLEREHLDQIERFVYAADVRAQQIGAPRTNRSQALRHAWRMYVTSLPTKLRAYVEEGK